MREFVMANNKISVAPDFSKSSIIREESSRLTRAETATAMIQAEMSEKEGKRKE